MRIPLTVVFIYNIQSLALVTPCGDAACVLDSMQEIGRPTAVTLMNVLSYEMAGTYFVDKVFGSLRLVEVRTHRYL